VRRLVLLGVVGCGRIGFDPLVGNGPISSCTEPEVAIEPITTDGLSTTPALVATDGALALAYGTPSRTQIAARRIELDGVPSASTTVAGLGTGGAGRPALAWTGTDVALVRLATFNNSTNNGSVTMTRLDDRMNRRAADVTVTTTATDMGAPSIAWNGVVYGATWIAWDTAKFQLGGWFAPLAPDGTRTGDGVMAADAGDCFCTPAMAWTGNEWGIVFDNDGLGVTPESHIGLTRVDAAGNLIASPMLVSDEGVASFDPLIAWTGTANFVAWSDELAAVHTAIVAPDATRLANQTTPAPSMRDLAMTILSDGVAVAFTDMAGVAVWLFDRGGQPLGEPLRLVDTPDARNVAIAAIDDVVYVAWSTAPAGGTGDVSLARAACR
jgi:hypothetical protein